MNFIKKIKSLLNTDIKEEKYSYTKDEKFGIIAKNNAPTKWVKSTCGYCGVGCGLYIGVKDGKAVRTKGDPEHFVSKGTLCPKGLTEHQMLNSSNRFTHTIGHFYEKYIASTRRRASKYIEKYGVLGLIIFVSIPLPATGIWSGSLAGFLIGIDKEKMVLALIVGGRILFSLSGNGAERKKGYYGMKTPVALPPVLSLAAAAAVFRCSHPSFGVVVMMATNIVTILCSQTPE